MRSALLVALMVEAWSAVAGAQDVERARAIFEEGERQFQAQNYQLALTSYEESYQLMEGHENQSLILWNIGTCQQELGRSADALSSFEHFLRDAPPDAPFRTEAVDRVRDLRAQVGSGTSGSLLLAGIALAGVGGAALIASIPTGVLALDAEAQLVEICPDDRCEPDALGLLDEGNALAIATDVLWIAGAAIGAVGAALLIVGLIGQDSVSAGASCTEDGCVGTLRARF